MAAEAPDRRLFFLLSTAQKRVQRWLNAQMASRGDLTQAQAGVLFFLGRNDGALIGEAAQALDVAPSAMTGIIDRMARAGLVTRGQNELDARGQRIYLTEQGRAARAQARRGLEKANAVLAEGFTQAELDVVARWLASLARKFPRNEQEGSES